MTATITHLDEFLAARRVVRDCLTPTPKPLAGMCLYSDGSFRLVEQCQTPAQFVAMFAAMQAACLELTALQQERIGI